MTPSLAQYCNRTVLVSIPALFEDGFCRSYKLIGAELNGLWLQSEELTKRLLSNETPQRLAQMELAVFVPFAQIAAVLVTTGPPPKEFMQAMLKIQGTGKTHVKTKEKHPEDQREEHHKRKRR